MAHRTYKASLAAAALLGSLALSPMAHAEGRDSGVGKLIAAQGNQALELIRAEVKAAVQSMKPSLPKGHLAKVSLPAGQVSPPAGTSGGATIVAAATVRCAE